MKQKLTQLGAAGLALAGYTLWVFTDTCLKFTGSASAQTRLPPAEVIAGVGLAMCLLLLAYAAARRDFSVLRPRRPGRQALRSALDLLNNFSVVLALRHLPLAMFYILVFCSPLVTTLIAAVLLRERLTWRRTLAVLAGFAGVVVAIDPLGIARPGDWTGYAACAVCVAAFSGNMVWSRVMTQTESWESMTFFSGAASVLVGSAAMLGHVQPVQARMSGFLAAAGLFGVVGCFCFFAALRRSSASVVSQFHYSQLLTGAVVGYAIWRERLTSAMVLGAGLIIAAGIYTAVQKELPQGPAEEPWMVGGEPSD